MEKYIVRSKMLQKGEWKDAMSTFDNLTLAEHKAKSLSADFDEGKMYFDYGHIGAWEVTINKATIEEEEVMKYSGGEVRDGC